MYSDLKKAEELLRQAIAFRTNAFEMRNSDPQAAEKLTELAEENEAKAEELTPLPEARYAT
jgi:hypothetical protein